MLIAFHEHQLNSKFASDSLAKLALLAVKMSLPMENRRSIAALKGMAVLYYMNKSMYTCSPIKIASVTASFEPSFNQLFISVCASNSVA
jgi:hypothetical protein